MTGIQTYVTEYMAWMKLMNYAVLSQSTTRAALNGFAHWCDTRGIEDLKEVDLSTLEHYQRWLYNYRKKDGHPLKLTTQQGRLIHVKSLFKWLTKKAVIPSDPGLDLELPRKPEELPRSIMSHAETEQVLNAPDLQTDLGIRDRALLETLYSTGMRRLELSNLKLYDLEMAEGMVMIRKGKGGRDRKLPIGERAVKWIDKYVREVRSKHVNVADSDILFLGNRGRQLCADAISHIGRKYMKKAGIDKPGSCHIFRHGMATQMLEAGADIRFIQQMLGHRKLTSTQIYTKVAISKLKEVHTKTHPSSRLNPKSQA